MPHTAPPARYDLPWKTALTHAFREFMCFFFTDLATRIDWKKPQRFCDKELAGVGFGGKPNNMLADKLVEVSLIDGCAYRVLIHLEVQAQRDASIGCRMLDYNYRICKEYKKPVCSLVLLADEDLHWRPNSYHNELLGTVMGIFFPSAKLLDYAARHDELLASHNPFALITMAHLNTQLTRHDPDARYAAKWQLTKLLFQHNWRKERIIILFKVIDWMMALPAPHQNSYLRALEEWKRGPEMKHEMWRNILPEEEWFSPTQQLMYDNGIKRNRKEEAMTILERQLTRRFGPLPEAVQKKLAKASLTKLRAWSESVLDAPSLQQLFQ